VTYDAAFLCSVALLRGLELRSGTTRVRLSPGRVRLPYKIDAYDQAQWFVQTVGDEKALRAAHRALNTTERKKKVKWI
jgi:hypothetical protein